MMRAVERTDEEPVARFGGWARREGGDVDPRGAALVRAVTAASGQPLPTEVRRDLEPRLGHDLRSVRIHADGAAARSAAALGARALTVGDHVVLGAGEYHPGTGAGRRVLAHELAHVAQHRESVASGTGRSGLMVESGEGAERDADRRALSPAQAAHSRALAPAAPAVPGQPAPDTVVQRLKREPYPWSGVITPAIGANVRSSPGASDPTTIMFAVPRGTHVTVLGASGEWLRVQTDFRGVTETGWVAHRLVDDAAAAEMEATVGTTMVWRPSGPGSGTDFEAWASAATETPFPAVSAGTVMNCWEAVLLAAYRAGAIDWAWIHSLYTTGSPSTWVARMSRGPRRTYSIPGPNLHMPQRGDLVFFDGLAHVAMATGNGSDVYTFWPPPNTPFTPGGTTDKVKVFSIEDLVAWWAANMPPAPVVEFAAPNW